MGLPHRRAAAVDGASRLRRLRLVGLAISGLALVIVLASMDVQGAMALMAEARPAFLAIALGVLPVQLLLRAGRWSVLLPRRADGRRVRLRVALPALLVGYLGNTILPARLGEPIRAAVVARREQLQFMEAFGATVVERVLDTATLSMVAFVAALTLGTSSSIIALTGTAAAVGMLVLGLLVSVGLGGVTASLTGRVRRWSRSPRIGAVAERVVGFARGIDRGRSPARLATAAAISCCCWALDALLFWLVAQALGVALSPPAAVLIAGVTVLVTAIPAAPGYVGTYEVAATSMAAALGIPGTEALAVAILTHVLTTVPLALGGVVATSLMGARLLERPSDPPTGAALPMTSPRLDAVGRS